MPLFLIERNFAEQLEVNRDSAAEVRQVNDDCRHPMVVLFPECRQEENLLSV